MPEVVMVSSVENMDKLKTKIGELFKNGKYSEITQSIGMHSLLIDPKHTLSDQAGLYRIVLNLLKNRISVSTGKNYGTWYEQFPNIMDKLIRAKEIVTDAATLDVLSSHREAYGTFTSADSFFFWALDDRRMTLEQIVKYIERTAEMHRIKA
jgi:hypothetical protein